MKSPKFLDTICSVFKPGQGKRRKGRAVARLTPAPVIPAKPDYPPPVPASVFWDETQGITLDSIPDYLEAERMVMDRLATDGLGALASLRDAYRISVRRGEDAPTRPPMGSMTGRVTIRSTNPEMDAWITRTPKTLVKASDVQEVSPTVMPSTGTQAYRLVLSRPAMRVLTPVPAPRGSEVGARLLVAAGARTADPEDTMSDMLITDAWRGMFSSDVAHVCRACHVLISGTVHADGTWECAGCRAVGRY